MNQANPNVTAPGNQSQSSIEDDVLHIPRTSNLTPEEIAKAVAHHNRHHSKDKQVKAQSTGTAKKYK
jgi:hypothetical protein